MHLGKTFPLFCLISGAFSYKIRAFTGEDCTGDAKEVNVWDNTCRDSNIPETKSFRVLEYGGYHQRATFFLGAACFTEDAASASWWADGGSDEFIKDKCLNLGSLPMHAFGSISG